MKRRLLICSVLAVLLYGTWCRVYRFDRNEAAEFITENALSRSHTCCAWFVMRGMQAGGCPIGILPAWMYRYVLPFYGFEEVGKKNYSPRKGDIVVFPAVGRHIWGHIAMWNGRQWVSDFRQKNLICAKAYSGTDYRYFRYK